MGIPLGETPENKIEVRQNNMLLKSSSSYRNFSHHKSGWKDSLVQSDVRSKPDFDLSSDVDSNHLGLSNFLQHGIDEYSLVEDDENGSDRVEDNNEGRVSVIAKLGLKKAER